MNKFYRIIMLAVAVCLALSLALFAGCKQDEGFTLTLDAAGGGTLSQSELKVAADQNILDAIGDVTLTADSGLTFAGWLDGDNLIDENSVMPQEDLTLKARYSISYTVRVYYSDINGEYPQQPSEQTTGTGFWHEACTVNTDGLQGATDAAKANKLSVDSLEKGEVFDVYRKRDIARIVFDINLDGNDATFFDDVVMGDQHTLPNGDRFEADDSVRFVGWSSARDDNIEFVEGDKFDVTKNNTRLYAQWEHGLTDIFDGADYLFVSRTQDNTVYLRRHGLEEKTGTYDSATGVFGFDNGLGGKVVGNNFYYYRDTLNRDYADYNEPDSQRKLTISDGGAATYFDGSKTYSGSYDVEKDSGFYKFQSGQLNFLFVLRQSGENVFFQRQDADIAGYYALNADGKFSYPQLYLNGVGTATYIMDGATYEATYDGQPILEYTGTYAMTHEEGTYEVVLYYRSMLMHTLYLRLVREDKPSVPDTVGYYQLNDGITQGITDGFLSKTDNKKLVLDGYGEGTYDGKKGTYRVIEHTWEYMDLSAADSAQELEDIISTYHVYYVEFTPQGADPILCFIWDEQDMATGTYVTYYKILTGEGYGRYDVTNNTVLDELSGIRQSGAFVYIYPEGPSDGYGPQLWIPAMYFSNRVVYSLADSADSATFSDGYLSLHKTVDEVSQVTMRFALNKQSSLNQRGSLEFVSDAITVDTDLSIDEKGVAHLGDETVDYTFDKQVVDVYEFDLGDGNKRIYYAIDGKFYRIDEKTACTETVSHPARASGYNADIVFVTDTIAVVRLDADDGQGGAYKYCILLGSVSPVAGKTDEYNFVGEYHDSDIDSDEVLTIYDHFRYKKTGNKFERYDEHELSVGGLVTDGYGNATYNGRSGHYAYMQGVVLFADDKGELALKVSGNSVKQVKADEVGTYYVITADGVSSYEQYFLDGDGVAVYSSFSADTNEFTTKTGTYVRLAKSAVEGLDEYTITFSDGKANIALVLREEDHIGYYVARDDNYLVDVKIVDDKSNETGSLFCNGYTAGTMSLDGVTVEAQVMRCNILDGDVSELTYELAADGKQIVAVTEDGEEYVFDINKDGKAVQRLLPYGTYQRNEHGVSADETIYLDGHGTATRLDADGKQIEQGAYTYNNPDRTELVYTGAQGSFVFVLQEASAGLEYLVLDAQQHGTLLSDDEWSSLILDGYGAATYTDRYGISGDGTYTFVTSWLVKFQSSALSHALYFDVDLDNKTQQVFNTDFVVRDSVLYGYTGSKTTITIPDEVTQIYANAFVSTTVEHVNFNKVTHIGSGAFAASLIVEVASDKLLYIGEGAFRDCRFLETVNILGVTEIAAEAFYHCTALTSVSLGAITTIGDRAFSEFKVADVTAPIRFDLTAVQTIANIAFGEDVFRAFDNDDVLDEGIAIVVIVKDMQAVNTVLSSSKWALVKGSVTMPVGDEDGRQFIDLDSGTVYQLRNGYFCEVVTGAYTLRYTNLGLYAIENGKLALYEFDEKSGVFVKVADLGDKVLSWQGKLLCRLDETHQLTVGDKQLSLTISAVYDKDHHYFDVTFAGSYGDTQVGSASKFDNTFGAMLVLDNTYYSLKLTDGQHGTLTTLGSEQVYEGEPKQTNLYAWRLTALVIEGEIHAVNKLEIKANSNYGFNTWKLQSVTINDDGSVSLVAQYSIDTLCFTAQVAGNTMTLVWSGSIDFASTSSTSTLACSATVLYDTNGKAQQLLSFAIDDEEVEFTATLNTDGSFTVVVGEDSYKVTVNSEYHFLDVEKV